MSLSISNTLSDDGAMEEEDSATFWALSSWGYEAVRREQNPRFGLRVNRVIRTLQKDVWVEEFIRNLNFTQQRKRSLSLEFQRRGYREGHVLNFTGLLLEAIGILPITLAFSSNPKLYFYLLAFILFTKILNLCVQDEQAEILQLVNRLRDH